MPITKHAAIDRHFKSIASHVCDMNQPLLSRKGNSILADDPDAVLYVSRLITTG